MSKTEVILRKSTVQSGKTDDSTTSTAPVAEDKTIKIDTRSESTSGWKNDSTGTAPLESQYTVIRKIGEGGMGIVHLGQDIKLGRHVAIKRLNKANLVHSSFTQRFFQEAKTVASLAHSNIVHVYALDEDEQGPYIVMEYVPGPPERSPDVAPPTPFSLVDLVQKDGPMSVTNTLDLMIKISKAIEYAHRCGVIHRDLKPSNVLLDSNSEPKIVDFGLARKSNPDDKKLTVPGEKMLSLGYGAPEQESDAYDSDQRADIYGLGALMYFCLTGQNPRYFRESDLPKEVQSPITKALETNREKRWATAKEFIDALNKIQTPSIIELPTVKTTWRCKWCDTVNPVSIQYCEDCGWDGITPCLECGARMHVGIQYCGECGADAREYEASSRQLERLRKKNGEMDFTYVSKHAERTASFKPAGPNGRKILEEILSLREKAEKTLERMKMLREIIPMELSSENFERAKQYIDEYNTLSLSDEFRAELKQIPAMIAKRDLARAEKELRKGNLNEARRIASAVLHTNRMSADEAEEILNRIRIRNALRITHTTLITTCLLFLLYILSAAPAYRYTTDKSTFSPLYSLEGGIHDKTFMTRPLDLYAGLWNVNHMYKERALTRSRNAVNGNAAGTRTADVIAPLRSKFELVTLKIDSEYERQVANWPDEYLTALKQLKQKMQEEGYYDGWNEVRDEIYYFEVYQKITHDYLAFYTAQELPELKEKFASLQKKYETVRNQAIATESGKYVESLKELQKQLTKEGRMDEASSVNAEVKRIQNNARINAAINAIEKDKPARPLAEESPARPLAEESPTGEKMRNEIEQGDNGNK